jgi:Bacterial capsule synthesis protein PGA_cap
MTDGPQASQRAERRSKLLVIALVGAFLFGVVGFAIAVIDSRSEPPPTQPPPPSLPALEAAGPDGSTVSAPRAPTTMRLALAETHPAEPSPPVASPSPQASPTTPGEPSADSRSTLNTSMPVVPVAGFWSTRDGIRRAEVVRALATGKADGFKRVVVEERLAEPLAAVLGTELDASVRRLGDGEALARAVRKGALGIVAADSLRPSLRALEVGGAALVGVERVKRLADWPLTVELALPADGSWDQARTWVLVAGGDSFTDRGVYDTVVRQGKGVDYPFDGGTAAVTGHACCDPVFRDNVVPRYELTGDRGVVRTLLRGADLAIANHEQPVTDAWAFHSGGLRFSGKPALSRMFSRAGFDFLSLANNHIGDYGADGIADSRRILRQNGIVVGGAGKDLDQARKVQLLEAGDTSVAVIPCLDIVKVYWAADGKAGATPCVDQYIRKDIRKARQAGADVVIVFPHWGVEYTRQPLESMRHHAARWIDAGADMVIGSHSHVTGAIEEIDGVPVFYSMGNLIFDQHWSTDTMESALLQVTFHGDTPVELRLLPYIIHDTSQPNLLDPGSGEGRRLLLDVKRASSAWLDW